MIYLVVVLALLVLGVLTFALTERSAKFHAQKMLAETASMLDNEKRNHHATQKLLTAATSARRREIESSRVLRQLLTQARTRLSHCEDPKMVRAWLEEELSDTDV